MRESVLGELLGTARLFISQGFFSLSYLFGRGELVRRSGKGLQGFELSYSSGRGGDR